MTLRNFAQTAFRIFFAFALPVLVMLSGSGCSKYTTDAELQEALDENSASVAQAIYDSLSHIYNGVEVYSGSSAGGDSSPSFEPSSSNAYNGANHYRSLLIPGGLNPGDKVFVVSELRFTRSGSNNINVTPQSVISFTNSPNAFPDPDPATPYAIFNNDEVWNLQEATKSIDRSGIHIHTLTIGTWNTAYVNFYARVVYSGSTSSTLTVGGHSLSVIVVRA